MKKNLTFFFEDLVEEGMRSYLQDLKELPQVLRKVTELAYKHGRYDAYLDASSLVNVEKDMASLSRDDSLEYISQQLQTKLMRYEND